MILRCSGGPETTTLLSCESPMISVLPTSNDSGPEIASGLDRLLPPMLLPPREPENPPVVPVREEVELRVAPVRPPLLRELDVGLRAPERELPPST